MRAVIWRALAFLGLWLVLAGADLADLPAATIAVIAATWTSLRLMPPSESRPSLIALASLALRFLRQSLVAGADVAWRALDPRLPLRTGFVSYPVRFPPGPARNVFTTLTSLLPGTDEAGLSRALRHD
jgi:multicomponent Na+:H+ antiporter subunit E